MRKRKTLGGILRLPYPSSADLKKRRKPDRCDECNNPFAFGRGYARCETCQTTIAVPIARILNKGPHHGKEVYLKDTILMELRAEHGDPDDVKEAFLDELHTREYIVIDEIRREN